MTDGDAVSGFGMVLEFLRAVGPIITPIFLAWITWRTNQTHKAVNSTATILAEEKKVDQLRINAQDATIAQLRAESAAAHQATEVREARAMPPQG